jgi:hypothetical protein
MALRHYFEEIITPVFFAQDSNTVPLSLFACFAVLLVLAALLIHFLMSERARIWFWNTFILLQLLPRDELDREFIKNINEFLRAA